MLLVLVFFDVSFDLKFCGLILVLNCLFYCFWCWIPLCSAIDSIMRLMSIWRITGKIIRTTIVLITYAHV